MFSLKKMFLFAGMFAWTAIASQKPGLAASPDPIQNIKKQTAQIETDCGRLKINYSYSNYSQLAWKASTQLFQVLRKATRAAQMATSLEAAQNALTVAQRAQQTFGIIASTAKMEHADDKKYATHRYVTGVYYGANRSAFLLEELLDNSGLESEVNAQIAGIREDQKNIETTRDCLQKILSLRKRNQRFKQKIELLTSQHQYPGHGISVTHYSIDNTLNNLMKILGHINQHISVIHTANKIADNLKQILKLKPLLSKKQPRSFLFTAQDRVSAPVLAARRLQAATQKIERFTGWPHCPNNPWPDINKASGHIGNIKYGHIFIDPKLSPLTPDQWGQATKELYELDSMKPKRSVPSR